MSFMYMYLGLQNQWQAGCIVMSSRMDLGYGSSELKGVGFIVGGWGVLCYLPIWDNGSRYIVGGWVGGGGPCYALSIYQYRYQRLQNYRQVHTGCIAMSSVVDLDIEGGGILSMLRDTTSGRQAVQPCHILVDLDIYMYFKKTVESVSILSIFRLI